MEDEFDDYQECFSQEGILLKEAPPSHETYIDSIGIIIIHESKKDGEDLKKFMLEWKPNDITIDSDIQYQEWAVVNTVQKRYRTLSGTIPDPHVKFRCLKINFDIIKSFKVQNKGRQLTFYDGSSEVLCSFLFQCGNCDVLVAALKTHLRIGTSKRDRQLYVIYDSDSPEYQQLNKSFAALNIKHDHSLWDFVKNIKDNSYEGSLGAFAKVTNIVFSSLDGTRYPDEITKDDLNNSITELGDEIVHSMAPSLEDGVSSAFQLPPRKEFVRCNPLTEEQWDSQLNSSGQLEDVDDIKMSIFKGGVHPSIRKEVWKFLLDYYPWSSTHSERQALVKVKRDEYYRMKLQWKSFSKQQENNFLDYAQRKSLVEKDVARTDRTLEFYAGDNNINLQTLKDILMTYVMYNFDLGYVQGMSDLLSPILWLMLDECDAFWCFVGFMDKVMSNFEIDQAGMKEQLTNLHVLLNFVDPKLANYLVEHECGNMFFCFRWLLVWFKRELSQEDVMRFWEVLWTGYPCQNFHLLVSVAILEHERNALMEEERGFTEILKYINELSGKLDISLMICKAEGIFHQINDSDYLSDSVRPILGLPVIGTNNLDSHEQSPFESPDISSTGTQPCCSVENVRISPDEIAYEDSIGSNFL
ncbi:TBC1 domain family member 15/17 [Rhynchophorus ferrugineus]|uniref:TBC1 domain family member 15/17 n=1 Tax=Rhynchophorus ferrugineus TaxID=354439 RepID=UPI003FCE1EAF